MTAIAALYSDEVGLWEGGGGREGGGREEGREVSAYWKHVLHWEVVCDKLAPDWILFSGVSAQVEEQWL